MLVQMKYTSVGNNRQEMGGDIFFLLYFWKDVLPKKILVTERYFKLHAAIRNRLILSVKINIENVSTGT